VYTSFSFYFSLREKKTNTGRLDSPFTRLPLRLGKGITQFGKMMRGRTGVGMEVGLFGCVDVWMCGCGCVDFFRCACGFACADIEKNGLLSSHVVALGQRHDEAGCNTA
jgi:hypothetical protein